MAILLLSACAGTARGLKTSSLQHDANLEMTDISLSQADANVIIRYPAVVEETAVQAYYDAFAENAIGGSVDLDDQQRRETNQVAQSLIAKSNYFAMSLYKELNDALPANTVLLSPHMIVLEDGHLSSSPLLATEEIPSVVTIDFNVYSFPDPRTMMDSEPLTFGDIITPLFVIHANRWLRPSTHGLLLSSNPLIAASWAESESRADLEFNSRLEASLDRHGRPLDFVSFLDRGGQRIPDIPLKSGGEARREVIAVEQYPIEKIRMDGEVIASLPMDHSVDPFAEDFVKGASTRIVTALNRVDQDRATFFSRQQVVAGFDPDLAHAVLSRSTEDNARTRLAMAETLMAAERKFLAAQSANLFEGIYQGTYGEQMRQMIAAEYRLLEERRELARAQNLSTALAVVAMVGAVYAGSSNSDNLIPSRTMGNALILSSVWAMNSAMSASAESKTIGQNFLAQMAPAINRQVSVQVEWLESQQLISASDFAGFRDKTLALYQDSIRSVSEAVDRQCKFSHPGLKSSGRWYGSCFGGVASGSGYGVVVDDSGDMVEFFGSAESGVASGTGAMIFNSPGKIGAIYYEGDFRNGWPDGVVLVEQPGRKPVVRKYHAGFDKGSADEADLQRLRF
jgi:hypothetical protein